MARTAFGKKQTTVRVGACTLTVTRAPGGVAEGVLRRPGARESWRGVGKSPLDVMVSGLRYGLEDSPHSCGFDPRMPDAQPLAERERVRKMLARSLAALRRK